jgi:hypothetical protein
MTSRPAANLAAALLKVFNDAAEADARRGDYQSLIANARIGRLTKSQQRLVADILENSVKRRWGNPPNNIIKTGDRRMKIGDHVLDLERSGMVTKAAVSRTIEDLEVSERTVWAARKFAIGYYKIERLVSELLGKS